MIIPILLALFAVPDLPEARDAASAISAQMASAPDRTARGSILASDIKQDGPVEPSRSDAPRSPKPPDESYDPGSNRDLERPQRASPEAANDLFQLLKQAGPKQGSKPK
jgi:hypothetical protein